MELFGARVHASPSMETAAGRAILERDPQCRGSLGIAISEAVEVAVQDSGTKYALGSVLNHVLLAQSMIDAVGVPQLEAFRAGVLFARAEGIVPAPEANHAVAAALREAERCREEGKSRAILFNLCGHGHFDMQAYTDYFAGKLKDFAYPAEEIAAALAGLPPVNA